MIGLVGTAPKADDALFPLNTPKLIRNRKQLKGLGKEGTLPVAFAGIFAQTMAKVVMIRVEDKAGMKKIDNPFHGIQGLLAAESVVFEKPSILIAPGFSADEVIAGLLERWQSV